MAKTASDFLVQRLYEWGVRRIFGYPGDGINGIMGALGRVEGKIDFIQARHEELAAFQACAHAKLTGEAGVCLATSGPGAIHLLNGLYDAKPEGFTPGGMSLHNTMLPHGPDRDAFEGASNAQLKPHKLENTMAFMFETRFPQRVTAYAANAPELQETYRDYGHALQVHFDPGKK